LRVIIFVAQQLPSGPGTPHCRASRSLSETAHSVGLPWTSDQPEAQASTLHHKTLTREREGERYPCSRWDSNPQSHQHTNGRKLTS